MSDGTHRLDGSDLLDEVELPALLLLLLLRRLTEELLLLPRDFFHCVGSTTETRRLLTARCGGQEWRGACLGRGGADGLTDVLLLLVQSCLGRLGVLVSVGHRLPQLPGLLLLLQPLLGLFLHQLGGL